MREQLVDRYLAEQGTEYGVFVVAFLDAPGIRKTHKPIWKSIDLASRELTSQAEKIREESAGIIHVAAVVIDARLPGTKGPGKAKPRATPRVKSVARAAKGKARVLGKKQPRKAKARAVPARTRNNARAAKGKARVLGKKPPRKAKPRAAPARGKSVARAAKGKTQRSLKTNFEE